MVLPVHDRNPLRRRPVVTWALIAVNIAVFVLATPLLTSIGGVAQPSAGGLCDQERFFDEYGAIPKELLDNPQLPGAPSGQAVTVRGRVGCVETTPPRFHKSPFVSVLTAMFLHGGW